MNSIQSSNYLTKFLFIMLISGISTFSYAQATPYVGVSQLEIDGSSHTINFAAFKPMVLNAGVAINSSIAMELRLAQNYTKNGFRLNNFHDFHLISTIPLYQRLSFYAKLGLSDFDIITTNNNNQRLNAELNPSYGFGLRYDINDTYFISVDWSQVINRNINTYEESLESFGLGIFYKFSLGR